MNGERRAVRRPGGAGVGGRAAVSVGDLAAGRRTHSHSLVPPAAPIRWLSRAAFARRRPILLPRSACRPSSFRRRCPSPSFIPPDASRGDGRPVSDFWQRLLFSLAEGVDRARRVVRGDLARKERSE